MAGSQSRVRWNLHTNALPHSDTARLLLVGKTNANLLFQDCEEMMVGHDVAITCMKRLAQTDWNLTPSALLIWHHLLLVRDREVATSNMPSGTLQDSWPACPSSRWSRMELSG